MRVYHMGTSRLTTSPSPFLHDPGRSLRRQVILLGTGTSHGVPVVGCACSTCRSKNRQNHRTRCSALVGLPEGNLLIDTPPELRLQLLREQIGLVHAVLFTHEHADHLFGLDDLRIFGQYLGHDIPIYCDQRVEARIRQAFSYAFDPAQDKYYAGGVPRLVFHRLDGQTLSILGAEVTPIRLWHGKTPVWGFRFGNMAYCTDTNQVPQESRPLLAGLDVLVLDCLRRRPHATHFHVEAAVQTAAELGARKTYFTHLCHDLEHATFAQSLPPGMEPAYDGLVIDLKQGVGHRR